ncbi:hypothetical protein NDU88_002663 [Pleurodeles waltl]|uniref:Uncharacterized protein n=1 Tax=Pleurodeles waltl TaxID=8319 RepID=A0AAV7T367_PLEWA|nr:hypothetical protein NDU88_002663 [Pleurodeles waltl]
MFNHIELEAVERSLIFESMASMRRPTAAISWSMRFMTVSERVSAEEAVELGTTRAAGEAMGRGREITSENSSWRVCLPDALPVGITDLRDPDCPEALPWQRAVERCGAGPARSPTHRCRSRGRSPIRRAPY